MTIEEGPPLSSWQAAINNEASRNKWNKIFFMMFELLSNSGIVIRLYKESVELSVYCAEGSGKPVNK